MSHFFRTVQNVFAPRALTLLLLGSIVPLGCHSEIGAVAESPPPQAETGFELKFPAKTETPAVVEGTVKTAVADLSSDKGESKPAATPDDSTRFRLERVKAYPAGSSAATTRTGEDWPRFLGPRDTGVSGETGLLSKWPKSGPPIVWEKEIGTGYSAPSIRGNLLVLHHRLRNEEIVDCFEADTGKPLWKYAYPTNFRDPYGYNNGPRCSPLLTADRCYTFGAEGKLLCLNLKDGKKIWLRDTAADWDVPEAFFGVGSTPILLGDLLIVMVGGEPRSGVVAFKAQDGATVWESVGKTAWKIPDAGFQVDDKLASYASLLAAQFHGQWHVLSLMRDGLVSLDPESGKIRFSYFFRSRSFESVNAARPVVIGDQIFLSAAYRAGCALLKVDPDGKGVTETWRNRNMETHWSTTIHHNGSLYGFSGRHEPEATFRCLDVKTGSVQWETEGADENAQVDPMNGLGFTEPRHFGRGSAILAEEKFIVLGERGVLALVEVSSKEFKEISRVKFPQMQYPSWAAPVLSRGRLYLRDEDHLLCVDVLKAGER